MRTRDAEPDEPTDRAAILISLAGVAAILAMVLLVDPLREAVGDALSGDTEKLREDLRGLGAGGVMMVLALAVAHSVIWYPAEILNAAAGFVFGFWPALALMMFGWLLNGILCHQVGRYAARPLLIRYLRRDRVEWLERAFERGGVTFLLAIRLIPIVPFSASSYVAGSARVPLWTFTWTTMVGYLPLTALFVLLGSRLEELSPTDPVIWGVAIATILLILFTRKLAPMLSHEDEEEQHGEEPSPGSPERETSERDTAHLTNSR